MLRVNRRANSVVEVQEARDRVSGHVEDARRLARQQGLDGDRWFDNAEAAMLLLSNKSHASKARYGYVRGIEPVSYVRDIRQRYRAYVEIAGRRLSQDESGEGAVRPSASPSMARAAGG